MDDFFKAILEDSGIKCASIPEGIEYHVRYSKDSTYEFFLNTSEDTVEINDISGFDILNNTDVNGSITLEPRRNLVIKHNK